MEPLRERIINALEGRVRGVFHLCIAKLLLKSLSCTTFLNRQRGKQIDTKITDAFITKLMKVQKSKGKKKEKITIIFCFDFCAPRVT